MQLVKQMEAKRILVKFVEKQKQRQSKLQDISLVRGKQFRNRVSLAMEFKKEPVESVERKKQEIQEKN